MFQNWRFKLRKADEAVKAGRLDEASDLFTQGKLTEYLPGKRLAAKLAVSFGKRAKQHCLANDWKAAWDDLDSALRFGGETRELISLRHEMSEAGLASVEAHLSAGDTSAAIQLLDGLDRHRTPSVTLESLRKVAKHLQSAEKLAGYGKFGEAEQQLLAATTLAPELAVIEQKRSEMRTRRERSRPLTEQLHRAISSEQWSDAVTLADQLLELAPESRLAQDARKKAWEAAGRLRATMAYSPSKTARNKYEVGPPLEDNRFVLWVDGVGGFLVCQSESVEIGQARPGNRVAVPIMADLAGKHARIERDVEGYWIDPLQTTQINGRAIHRRTMLSDGDELELGGGVRIRFRRPHALSASARLEFLSRHRTQPSADGVLLMAESCVLGPKWQNHVVCRDWSSDVVLYRHDETLYCRAMESIEIDGELCEGRGRLAANSHVVGSDFSMSLEELDRCSTQPLL